MSRTPTDANGTGGGDDPFAPRERFSGDEARGPSPALLAIVGMFAIALLALVMVAVAWPARKAPPAGGAPGQAASGAAGGSNQGGASSAPASPASPEPTGAAPGGEAKPTVARIGGSQREAQGRTADAESIRGSFVVATESLTFDAVEAQRRFGQTLAAARSVWPDLSREDTESLARMTIAHVMACAGAGGNAAVEAVDAVASPGLRIAPTATARLTADDLAGAAFALGCLAALAAEPDAPAVVRAAVSGAMARVNLAPPTSPGEGAFWSGVNVALRRAPSYIVAPAGAGSSDAGPEAVWRRWLACVGALAVARPESRDPLLLAGAREALGAMAGRPPDAVGRAIVQAALAQASWDAGAPGTPGATGSPGATDPPPARAGILECFDDRRISTRDLASVMAWLIGSAPAAGLGVECSLRPDATDAERIAVRDRVRAAWGVRPPGEADALRRRWLSEAGRALGAVVPSPSPITRLARVATLARLCEAAARLHRGEAGAGRAILDGLAAPIEAALASPGVSATTGSAPDPERDGKWALRFFAARRSANERRRAVAELANSTAALGPIDAETLLDAAVFGSPSDLRLAASRIAERRATDPPMVNALLELLPRAPRSDAMSSLVRRATGANLPPTRDLDWPLEARRALVASMLKSLSGASELGALDRLASVIATACAGWADAPQDRSASRSAGADPSLDAKQTGAASGAAQPTRDPATAVERARASLAAELTTFAANHPDRRDVALAGLAAAHRRHEARRSLAEGPAQAFEAGLLGAADVLALLVQAERPESDQAAAAALANLAAARRACEDVYESLDATMTAVGRLWALRLGADGPSPAQAPPALSAPPHPAVSPPRSRGVP